MRLLASDIDGTILCPGPDGRPGQISERTIAAFGAAADAGILVVLVTGRPIRWLDPIREALGHNGLIIAFNGAVVYDLGAERVVHSSAMALETMFEVRRSIIQLEPRVHFAAETLTDLYVDTHGLDLEETAFPVPDILPQPFEDSLLADDEIVKLLAKTRHHGADDFWQAVHAKVGAHVAVTRSAPEMTLVEISAKDVHKANTLARFAAEHGIAAEDVVAFGDMPNDIEMLSWAGTSYAMASGHKLAIQAASHVAPACGDDGVAQVVEYFLRWGVLPTSTQLEL
ncbi:HAD family hydrolase [Micrococcoides hystricis]|uniref:HAD family hydrolase n=1 Tax=Micrococcoides hystricis TaxID=1572761 RepID=A0ABV6PB99_9MICC